MNSHQERAIRALEASKGDDLYRFRMAFYGLTHSQMNETYGASGMTRAEVLARAEAHEAKVDEAIAWVRQAR